MLLLPQRAPSFRIHHTCSSHNTRNFWETSDDGALPGLILDPTRDHGRLGVAASVVVVLVLVGSALDEIEVGLMDGRIKRLPATVCETPFYDPKRERARA